MLNLENFSLKLLEDLSLTHTHAQLDKSGNHIRILCVGYIVELALLELFSDYKTHNNYVDILNRILDSINEFEHTDVGKIDFDKIYPLVKNQQDIVDAPEWLYRSYFLNLNICYVQDTGTSKRILTKHLLDEDKDISMKSIHEAAYKNLAKLQWTLEQPDENLDVYMVYGNHYSGSILGLNDLLDQVKSRLGNTFLTAMPNADLVIFSIDRTNEAELLKQIIHDDPLPRTSELLYRYDKDTFYYYDMNDILKIVK
ncbi:MAG: hypothetical protein CVU95_00375 [Firmicutes bacterium HGW-Firmicutes-2]|jgi:uncharacterized protein YtpQ (UPF0354 family)|nr:MAG: hypothetical protein CVU95_00375 [Firmicutes bacterium HGW-Firmicutes-2]